MPEISSTKPVTKESLVLSSNQKNLAHSLGRCLRIGWLQHISLIEEYSEAPLSGGLKGFHRVCVIVGSPSTDDFYHGIVGRLLLMTFITACMGQASTIVLSLSLSCTFPISSFIPPRRCLLEPCAVGARVNPTPRVSTRGATMMTGSLKHLYSPEQVCHSLSTCLLCWTPGKAIWPLSTVPRNTSTPCSLLKSPSCVLHIFFINSNIFVLLVTVEIQQL
jgi:hypothetical protein